jgi:hypothetical protein
LHSAFHQSPLLGAAVGQKNVRRGLELVGDDLALLGDDADLGPRGAEVPSEHVA